MIFVLAAAVVVGFAGAAVAVDASQFVIIKDKNQHCRVVEKNVVSEDKQAYPSFEEANLDLKVVCENP